MYLKHKGVILFKSYEVDQFVKSVDTDLRNRVRSLAGLEGFLAFICRQNVRFRKPPCHCMTTLNFSRPIKSEREAA